MTHYTNFTSQIPDTVLHKTEMYTSDNVALFKPTFYMGESRLEVSDYHLVIPSGNPPETFFNKKSIRLDQKKIMIINPGDIVTCSRTVQTKPYYSFLIKYSLMQKIARDMDFPGDVRFIDNLNPFSGQLLYVLKTFEKECNRPDRLKIMLDSLEILIVTLLLRECKTNMNFAVPSADVNSYISQAIEYIRTYFSSNITIDDICREVHVSPFHFIRMFKQKTGLSPHRYLLEIRIKKAVELLNSKCYTISEIAEVCGFTSISHFSSTFKEVTGFSPDSYKNQYG